MKITLRTKESQQRLVIQTQGDAIPPAMIRFPTDPKKADAKPLQIAMDWDGALDDEKCLRHCPVCSCSDMYVKNSFPQITTLVTITLAAVISLILIYNTWIVPALIVLGLVIFVDVLIYLLKKPALICYQCKSEFSKMPISRYHKRWEQGIADGHK